MKKPFCQAVLLLVLPGIAASQGCAQAWKRTQTAPPSDHVVLRDQLVVHSDFPLPAEHRLLEELTARRGDLSRRLGLPPGGEPVRRLSVFNILFDPRNTGRLIASTQDGLFQSIDSGESWRRLGQEPDGYLTTFLRLKAE